MNTSATRRVRLMGATETPAQIESRKNHQAALAAVTAAVEARFPLITSDNARDAIAFQRELLETLPQS